MIQPFDGSIPYHVAPKQINNDANGEIGISDETEISPFGDAACFDEKSKSLPQIRDGVEDVTNRVAMVYEKNEDAVGSRLHAFEYHLQKVASDYNIALQQLLEQNQLISSLKKENSSMRKKISMLECENYSLKAELSHFSDSAPCSSTSLDIT